jgi:hypothetical protein
VDSVEFVADLGEDFEGVALHEFVRVVALGVDVHPDHFEARLCVSSTSTTSTAVKVKQSRLSQY